MTFVPLSTKTKFGGEYFRFFLFLVMIQCIVNATFARVGKQRIILFGLHCHFVCSIVCAVKKMEVSLQPHFLFSALAFTYVGAMVASNSSLSWVSYPTQVSSAVQWNLYAEHLGTSHSVL